MSINDQQRSSINILSENSIKRLHRMPGGFQKRKRNRAIGISFSKEEKEQSNSNSIEFTTSSAIQAPHYVREPKQHNRTSNL